MISPSAIASTSRAYQSTSLLACTCRVGAAPILARTYAVQKAGKKVPIQQLRDDAIRHRYVRVVKDGSEGGGLSDISEKNAILKKLDRTKYWLLQVDEQEFSSFEAQRFNRRPGDVFGICKIINKKEAFDKEKEKQAERKAKKKAATVEEKELQLTWGVSMNDLGHKLKRAQTTLDKCGRVTLVVTAPKGSKAPNLPEREMFLQMCTTSLDESSSVNVTQFKPTERRGSQSMLHLQGVKSEAAKKEIQ